MRAAGAHAKRREVPQKPGEATQGARRDVRPPVCLHTSAIAPLFQALPLLLHRGLSAPAWACLSGGINRTMAASMLMSHQLENC